MHDKASLAFSSEEGHRHQTNTAEAKGYAVPEYGRREGEDHPLTLRRNVPKPTCQWQGNCKITSIGNVPCPGRTCWKRGRGPQSGPHPLVRQIAEQKSDPDGFFPINSFSFTGAWPLASDVARFEKLRLVARSFRAKHASFLREATRQNKGCQAEDACHGMLQTRPLEAKSA